MLAWKIPWTEEPGRLQSMGSLRVGTTERLHFRFSLSHIGEGNGGTHSGVLAWRIPGTEEPSGLPSMGSHRVGLKQLSCSSSGRDIQQGESHLISDGGVLQSLILEVCCHPSSKLTWRSEFKVFLHSLPGGYLTYNLTNRVTVSLLLHRIHCCIY